MECQQGSSMTLRPVQSPATGWTLMSSSCLFPACLNTLTTHLFLSCLVLTCVLFSSCLEMYTYTYFRVCLCVYVFTHKHTHTQVIFHRGTGQPILRQHSLASTLQTHEGGFVREEASPFPCPSLSVRLPCVNTHLHIYTLTHTHTRALNISHIRTGLVIACKAF